MSRQKWGNCCEPISAGECDFVIGSRMRGKREPGSMLISQIFAGWLAGVLLRLLYRVRYTDMGPFAPSPARLSPVTYARRNLRLESGDADALGPMRPAHPRNSRELSQSRRRSQQSCRFLKRLNSSRNPHHPNAATSGLNTAKTLVLHVQSWNGSPPCSLVFMRRDVGWPRSSNCGTLHQPLAFSAALSIAFHSSGERCNLAAAIFSSRCFTEEVPGIGSITGE